MQPVHCNPMYLNATMTRGEDCRFLPVVEFVQATFCSSSEALDDIDEVE